MPVIVKMSKEGRRRRGLGKRLAHIGVATEAQMISTKVCLKINAFRWGQMTGVGVEWAGKARETEKACG